jgi:hypothetical protein
MNLTVLAWEDGHTSRGWHDDIYASRLNGQSLWGMNRFFILILYKLDGFDEKSNAIGFASFVSKTSVGIQTERVF